MRVFDLTPADWTGWWHPVRNQVVQFSIFLWKYHLLFKSYIIIYVITYILFSILICNFVKSNPILEMLNNVHMVILIFFITYYMFQNNFLKLYKPRITICHDSVEHWYSFSKRDTWFNVLTSIFLISLTLKNGTML